MKRRISTPSLTLLLLQKYSTRMVSTRSRRKSRASTAILFLHLIAWLISSQLVVRMIWNLWCTSFATSIQVFFPLSNLSIRISITSICLSSWMKFSDTECTTKKSAIQESRNFFLKILCRPSSISSTLGMTQSQITNSWSFGLPPVKKMRSTLLNQSLWSTMIEWPKISFTTILSKTQDWDQKRRKKRTVTTIMGNLRWKRRKRRSLSEIWTSHMNLTVILESCQAMTGPLTSTLGKWMARKSRNRSLGNWYAIEGRIGEGAELEMDLSRATARIMIVSSRCSHRVWWVHSLLIVLALDLRAAASRERRTIFQRMADRPKVVEGSLNNSLIFSTKS